MDTSRRGFLKIGGICALGLGTLPVANVLAKQVEQLKALPTSEVVPGKKLGMVIDMKKCWEKGKQGCKDCITACHSVHNVPVIDDADDEIKWIWPESYESTFPSMVNEYNDQNMHGKNFLVLCNHCTNPACVRVCPTQATWKRKEDGIVMMDYHRCIGCRFCMAACPYGSRSFNFRDPRPYIQGEVNAAFPTRERGVVEKCNFCNERLSEGRLPACVEACKCGALCFGDLADAKSDVRKMLASRYSLRRKPELGTEPNVYYLV